MDEVNNRIKYLHQSIGRWCNRGCENKDRKLFKKWEEGLITTSQCINEFMKNNYIIIKPESFNEEGLFEEWLNSLGYRRSSRWLNQHLKE